MKTNNSKLVYIKMRSDMAKTIEELARLGHRTVEEQINFILYDQFARDERVNFQLIKNLDKSIPKEANLHKKAILKVIRDEAEQKSKILAIRK